MHDAVIRQTALGKINGNERRKKAEDQHSSPGKKTALMPASQVICRRELMRGSPLEANASLVSPHRGLRPGSAVRRHLPALSFAHFRHDSMFLFAYSIAPILSIASVDAASGVNPFHSTTLLGSTSSFVRCVKKSARVSTS